MEFVRRNRGDAFAEVQRCPVLRRAYRQHSGHGGRVAHAIVRNVEGASQPGADVRLLLPQPTLFHHLGANAVRCVRGNAPARTGEFLRIGCQPERTAIVEFAIVGKRRCQCPPPSARMRGESELRRSIIHGHEVPHRRATAPAAGEFGIVQRDRHAGLGQAKCGGCADESGTDDGDIGRQRHLHPNP